MITVDLANEYIDEDVLEIKQVTGRGEVNDTYIFTTNKNKYIVRIDLNETTLDRFQKEKWCMNEATKIGIPTPNVYKTGINQDHPYIVMEYIDGTDGDVLAINEQKKVWQKLGQYCRKIHSIEITGYGEKMISPGVFDGDWNKFVEYNIKSLNEQDKLISLGIIDLDQSRLLLDIFKKIKKSSFKFGLIHNDLSLNNTRVNKNGEVYFVRLGIC